MPRPGRAVERPRVDFTLASDVLAWVAERTGTGDPFTGESQAAELALARLRAEQGFIQAKCQEEGVRYEGDAFWSLYGNEIAASTPSRMGRRPRGVLPERSVKRMIAGIDADLLRWVDANCQPRGPFATASHATETALRHLQALKAPEPRIPGDAFRFPAAEWWRRYQRKLDSSS